MASAANWVDRNDPAETKIARCLAVYLGRKPATAVEAFGADALALLHIVAADGSEVQIASYIRSVERRVGFEPVDGRVRRTLALALWHVAKVGLVRDRLAAVAPPPAPPTSEHIGLSSWLSESLLRDRGANPAKDPAGPARRARSPARWPHSIVVVRRSPSAT